MGAGKKAPKKRGSQAGRWRKVDVDDVEEALEDERLVQKMKRQSGVQPTKNGKDTQADDLFTIDTAGSFEGISKTSRRELARAKIFPPKSPNIGLTASEELKISRAIHKVEARARPKAKPAPDVFDLWATPADSSNASGKAKVDSGVSRLRPAKTQPVKMPGTLHQKVGLAPAVLPAHEGQSMNPQRQAYEDLACMAAAAQLEKEHEAEELERKMKPVTALLRDAVGNERLKDMDEEEKAELYRSLVLKGKVTAEATGDEEGTSFDKVSKKWKQKSQSHRNKEKVRRDADAKEDQERSQRKMEKEVGNIGTYLKEMKQDDEWRSNRIKYRKSMREKRKELEATDGIVPKRRKLGGGTFVEEAAIVPDAEATGKGLRAMPLRTSAVKERLSSILRRGLLPAPSEANKEQRNRQKKRSNRQKNSRRFISPLLKDNLLLR